MAANTDKLLKGARAWVGQIGSGGVADASTATIPLASTTNLPTDTAVVAVIDRVDSNGTATPSLEEVVIGVVSGSNLATSTRGVEGTAQAHSAGAVVEILMTATNWNYLIDHLLVQHDQAGRHTNITTSNITASATATVASGIVQKTLTASHVTASAITASAVTFSNSDPNLAVSTQNIQVAGADPWRTITLPAKSWAPTTTAGCAASAKVEAGTNDIDYDVLDFDKATDENAYINFPMPASYDGGVIQFRYIWTAAGGSAAETLVFELSGRSFADDDAIDQAVGTPIEVSDALIATGDIHISAWSGDVTITGAGASELFHLEIMRDVSEDTLDADARLIAVQIRYRQGQYSD